MLLESAYDLWPALGALAGVLKYCKLQCKLDLTFKNPSVVPDVNRNVAAGSAQTL